MARIRTVKPEIKESETLGRVSREARLCFILLFTVADDDGRLRAPSRLLASQLFPYDDDAPGLIDGWLSELETHNHIRRYTVEGNAYIDIPNWLKHQKIDKPRPSSLPPFDEASRNVATNSGKVAGDRKGMEGIKERKGREPRAAVAPLEFDRFWQAYPRHEAKPDAERAFVKALKDIGIDAMLEALEKHKARWTDPQYVPHPATWLNKKRWLDELPGVVPKPPRSTADTYAVRRDAYLESGTSFWNDEWGPRPSREVAA
jgi:hypothetical protein